MRRTNRCAYLLLKAHRRNAWFKLPKSLREWDYRTTSLDPDDLADVYDMRLQVAEVLEQVNVEMRQLAAPTKAAYVEGASGGRWENSASKHKLNVLMDEVLPGKTPPLPKHIEWEGVAVPTLPLVLIAAGLFSALRDVALVLIGATSAVGLAYVPNERPERTGGFLLWFLMVDAHIGVGFLSGPRP